MYVRRWRLSFATTPTVETTVSNVENMDSDQEEDTLRTILQRGVRCGNLPPSHPSNRPKRWVSHLRPSSAGLRLAFGWPPLASCCPVRTFRAPPCEPGRLLPQCYPRLPSFFSRHARGTTHHHPRLRDRHTKTTYMYVPPSLGGRMIRTAAHSRLRFVRTSCSWLYVRSRET